MNPKMNKNICKKQLKDNKLNNIQNGKSFFK